MKILNKARIHRLKQTEHIHNEKNVLKQINHPFIVRLFNSFKDKTSLYLLLEFIPGGELFNYIRRSGKLSTEISRIYSAEIILALEHLHSKKILYRDLKPENILIDETGHVKLTDFGFSKFVPTDRTMSMCGTPEYIAPEIILNNGHGKAVDWWSLGILIFEMLAGYPPFSDEPNKTIFEKIPTERVEFPANFDALAQDLIEKLLVVDPSRRLGCGRNGAQDIKNHLWFAGLDWVAVSNKLVTGPVNPGITKDGDTHNFYKYSDVNLNEDLADDNPNLDEIFADF
jgi:serine/threonine protein kinase